MSWLEVSCGAFIVSLFLLGQAESYELVDYGDPEATLGLYEDLSNESSVPGCVFSLVPCSLTITGNLILIVFYGIILGVAAKMISDGAELLLDLGLPAAIIGGIVLPLLGAVPDSAMIIASGSSGNKTEANQQISVGMGTLAGSTIMLLTIPWLGSLLLGRVDIVNGQGVDKQTSKFTIKSLVHQGVTVFPDVTYSAIIMMVTALPYFIVQGSDWHWMAVNGTESSSKESVQPASIKNSALATLILAFLFFLAYLIIQVVYSVGSQRRDALRREEMLKRRVLKQMLLLTVRGQSSVQAASTTNTDGGAGDETKPLLSTGAQRKYFNAWRMHRGQQEPETTKEPEPDAEKAEKKGSNEGEKTAEEPKWKIILKSILLLTLGVGLVTVFSDPMVDVLTAIANSDNKNYFKGGKKGQHIPISPFYLSFVITPICSNASELVSSLVFAYKKTKVSASLTFSQLYGAATMNNTLCLGIFAALVYFKDLDWFYSAGKLLIWSCLWTCMAGLLLAAVLSVIRQQISQWMYASFNAPTPVGGGHALLLSLMYIHSLAMAVNGSHGTTETEVTVIIFVEFLVGITAVISGFGFRHTYILVTGFFIASLYIMSIVLVYILEHYAHWK